jgi:feruloyl esterase
VAKGLIQLYYDKPQQHSYFEGCSMGGREAMMVTQRLPSAFDGVVVGDPGFRFGSMLTHAVYNSQVLGGLASRMGIFSKNGLPLVNNTYTNQDLQLISKAVLDACDAFDGLVDGMVNKPLQCTTDVVAPKLDAVKCSGGKTASCLTADQIDTFKTIYAGPVTPSGAHPYFGWMWDPGIAGCTSAVDCNTPTATNISGGWRVWKLGNFAANPSTAENSALDFSDGTGGAAGTVIVPTPPILPANVNNEGTVSILMNANLDQYIALEHGTTPEFTVSGFDLLETSATSLAPFASHGGKVVIWQPQSGGPFSPLAMVDWYRTLNLNSGGSASNFAPTQQFARLFLMPGAAHCGGGPSTSTIDAFSAVVNWVENGTAPDRIVGTAPAATPWPGRTRPLCPFPAYAKYTGSGSIEDQANFVCATD